MAVDRNQEPDDLSMTSGTGRSDTEHSGGGAGAGDFSGGSYGAGGPFGGTAGISQDATRAANRPHFDGHDESLGERGSDLLDEGRERGRDMLREGRERAGEAADAGRDRIAGKLEELGGRLEERGREAQQRGGVQGRAGQAAVRAGGALDSSAEYLRSHDVDDMRDDLERQIRDRPLVSVGVALGAGFLLARILRD